MKYRYQLVDRISAQMREGVVYHTQEFELAGLLCACGCGHCISLLVTGAALDVEAGTYIMAAADVALVLLRPVAALGAVSEMVMRVQDWLLRHEHLFARQSEPVFPHRAM